MLTVHKSMTELASILLDTHNLYSGNTRSKRVLYANLQMNFDPSVVSEEYGGLTNDQLLYMGAAIPFCINDASLIKARKIHCYYI